MPTVVRIRGWGFALVNLPVVLPTAMEGARVTWIFAGMLVSRIGCGSGGLGLRPFVVYPPSCWGGGFHTTECYINVILIILILLLCRRKVHCVLQ